MSLSMLWRRLMRRPFVLMIIVVFAALAAWAGWNRTDGEAQSRTAVLVVPPWYVEDVTVPSPVLNLTDRTTQLASALVVAIQTDDTAAFVAEAGATGYAISNISDTLRNPAPSSVIQFVVTGPDGVTAHAGAARLIEKSRQVLTVMQLEASIGTQTNMAQLQVIVPPQETMRSSPPPSRTRLPRREYPFAKRTMRSAAVWRTCRRWRESTA